MGVARRRKYLLALAVIPVLALAGVAVGGDRRDDREDHHGKGRRFDPRVRVGFAIAPVPLDLEGRNREMVGLGSYIVNAQGGCNDCHTNPPYAPGGNPFLGEPKVINAARYLAGGMPFGPVVSANITPDATGRPAGLTADEFLELMRTGVDPEDGHILQVMPWPIYGNMTDQDLLSVYEYLSAIPSIP